MVSLSLGLYGLYEHDIRGGSPVPSRVLVFSESYTENSVDLSGVEPECKGCPRAALTPDDTDQTLKREGLVTGPYPDLAPH